MRICVCQVCHGVCVRPEYWLDCRTTATPSRMQFNLCGVLSVFTISHFGWPRGWAVSRSSVFGRPRQKGVCPRMLRFILFWNMCVFAKSWNFRPAKELYGQPAGDQTSFLDLALDLTTQTIPIYIYIYTYCGYLVYSQCSYWLIATKCYLPCLAQAMSCDEKHALQVAG